VDPKDFHFQSSFTVRFKDCDLLGHMNNAVYLTICEEARHEFYKEVGFRQPEPFSSESKGFILAAANVDFQSPAIFMEELTVYTRISRFGTKSYDMEYLIVSTNDKRVVAESTATLVAFDYKKNESIPVDEKNHI